MPSWVAITQRAWLERVKKLGSGQAHFWLPSSWKRRELGPGDRWYFREQVWSKTTGRLPLILGHGHVLAYEKTTPQKLYSDYGPLTGYASAVEIARAISDTDRAEADQLDRVLGNVKLDNVVIYTTPFTPPAALSFKLFITPNGRTYWPIDDSAITRLLPDTPPLRSIVEPLDANEIAKLPPSRREYLRELSVRDQTLPRKLRGLYDGRCQISGELPLGSLGLELAEAHHIKWLSEGGLDDLGNMVLLSPDWHRAIHAAEAVFDWSELSFDIQGQRIPLRLNKHLAKKHPEA